ncbi:MAG: hypothetical protein ACRDVE_00010 [Actinocrinis sp.]
MVTTTDYPNPRRGTMIRALKPKTTPAQALNSAEAPTITRRDHKDTHLARGAQDQGEGDTTMETGGARDKQEGEYPNPVHALARLLDHHTAKVPPPRPETDRRSNYRQPPTPPGVNLAVTDIEDAVKRDPAVIEHTYEVARATARNHAAQRISIRIDAASGRELLDYFDTHRPTLPAELGQRIDATMDRHLRAAYAASTRTRLVCPYCAGHTVVPTPDLKTLLCLDYVCAPKQPRRIDPAYAQEPDRRVTVKQLALLAGDADEGRLKKKIWRAGIKPVHTGPHGKHEFRWADVAHLVTPKPTPATPLAVNANRESRSGGIVRARAA